MNLQKLEYADCTSTFSPTLSVQPTDNQHLTTNHINNKYHQIVINFSIVSHVDDTIEISTHFQMASDGVLSNYIFRGKYHQN